MATVSNNQVVDIFKRVYGDLVNALPNNTLLAKEIPFSASQKVGDSFLIATALTNETGWTLAGSAQDAFDINPAIAGVVKQATITPSQTLLSSVIPFATISRSLGSEQAFAQATKLVMKNHLNSHEKLLEIMRLHGQATAELGYVSFAPSGTLYRGVAYTGSGTITLISNGTSVAFTAGVNTTLNAILLAPGQFASFWVGMEGCRINQIDSTSAVVASGKILSVDVDQGILYVDFTPIAASSTTSHRLCLEGMELAKEAVGISRILSNSGSLFGISASQYSLWKATQLDLGSRRFNMTAMQKIVSQAVNRGGLDKPLLFLVNPRTFGQMVNDEAALRKYDSSYNSKGQNGFEQIEYYAANGLNRIVAHPFMKEGEVYGLETSSWIRSGSAQISFKVPGMDSQEIIFPLQNQAAYMFRSFADQFVLCERPALNVLVTGVNDEGTAYAG